MAFDTNIEIGIIGGTGAQGHALALRFAQAGLVVRIGSRDASRAREAVDELVARDPSIADHVSGGSNADVAQASGLVVIAVPWDAHETTVRSLESALQGKVVVDCVNPLGFDKLGPFAVSVPAGSAAEQAQALLPTSTVVAAFHHLSAPLLSDVTNTSFDVDVLVVGDDRAAVDLVVSLAAMIPGMRGIAAGRLRNARQVEALTANLISINRRYKAHAAIRVTDV
jgi:8-hydroxy-5-deazaflavin:NADPH oxidoreductase